MKEFEDHTAEDAEYEWKVDRQEKLCRVDGYLLEFAKWYEHCGVKGDKVMLSINLRKTSEEILNGLTVQE